MLISMSLSDSGGTAGADLSGPQLVDLLLFGFSFGLSPICRRSGGLVVLVDRLGTKSGGGLRVVEVRLCR